MGDLTVGRRNAFRLFGALCLGGVAAGLGKLLPKPKIAPFVDGEMLTPRRINELVERINNG